MTIKVTLNESSSFGKAYPMLKKHACGELIVLFNAPESGAVIVPSALGSKPVGHYSGSWIEENFRVLQGSITLQNDP
jgi:hypothetical protein